jgi:hypothetical protein
LVISAGFPAFKIEVMRLHFQTDGKTPSASDLLKIEQVGELSTSRHRYRRGAAIPSSPVPLVFDNNLIDARTSATGTGDMQWKKGEMDSSIRR